MRQPDRRQVLGGEAAAGARGWLKPEARSVVGCYFAAAPPKRAPLARPPAPRPRPPPPDAQVISDEHGVDPTGTYHGDSDLQVSGKRPETHQRIAQPRACSRASRRPAAGTEPPPMAQHATPLAWGLACPRSWSASTSISTRRPVSERRPIHPPQPAPPPPPGRRRPAPPTHGTGPAALGLGVPGRASARPAQGGSQRRCQALKRPRCRWADGWESAPAAPRRAQRHAWARLLWARRAAGPSNALPSRPGEGAGLPSGLARRS